MKRSGDVTAAAIVLFFGCALLALFLGVGALGVLLTQAPPDQRMSQIFGLAIYGVFAAWGIVTGVGVLRLRPWARISMIVMSAAAIALCILVSAFLALVPGLVRDTPNLSPAVMKMIALIGIALMLVPVGIAIWWLILFTRKRVVLEFATHGAALAPAASFSPEAPFASAAMSSASPLSAADAAPFPAAPELQPFSAALVEATASIAPRPPLIPTSIRVIAIVALAFVPFSLYGMVLAIRTHLSVNLILGVLITSLPVWIHTSVEALIQITLAVAVLRKKMWALYGLIAWLLFSILNAALFIVSPAKSRFLDAVVHSRALPANVSFEAMKQFVGGYILISMVFSALLCAVGLYFLISRRKDYRAACTAPSGG